MSIPVQGGHLRRRIRHGIVLRLTVVVGLKYQFLLGVKFHFFLLVVEVHRRVANAHDCNLECKKHV